MLNNKEFDFLKVRLEKINNKIPHINRGGCGVFAVELAIRLKKIKVPCKLVIIDTWGIIDDYTDDLENNGYISPDSIKPSHVMVKVGRRYIDSDGVFNKSHIDNEWTDPNLFEIKPEQFIQAALTEYGWNPRFTRSKKSLDTIKRHLTKACSELKILQAKERKVVSKKKRK
jgi:hypothetical protein